MNTAVSSAIESYIEQENLPRSYLGNAQQWFIPLLDDVLKAVAAHQGTFVLGVSGCQGSGKSTLSGLLTLLLRESMGLRSVVLSIDDFYLTREERQRLASQVHPLLQTRGVPGTHDVNLALDTLAALKEEGEVSIPRFDKAVDDRVPAEQWHRVQAPLDVIVLEGWCLGIAAQPEQALQTPVNELERDEDPEGHWRSYVNECIRQAYMPLYALIDFLVMLKAPSFDNVLQWRQLQEAKLAEKLTMQSHEASATRLMSPAQIARFIQHYERITRHGLETLPQQADVVFHLDDRQHIQRRT